jgi:prepilin-type N-terminal cleavage/methylation domain-containing protein
MKAVKRKGFTLIEVCLVMLIFGVAVSSLMALFPVSLRQGTQAVSDSVVSAFGDSVMNSLAGVASSMQSEADWATWKTESKFKTAIIRGVKVDTSGDSPKGDQKGQIREGSEDKIEDYLGLGKKANNSKSGRINIRYKLDIAQVNQPDNYGGRLYRAILYVTDNPSLDLSYGTVFVTYLAYLGEVP